MTMKKILLTMFLGVLLVPLTETEAYIREQGHLPDVPSATEVEEEGLSLGEMNKVLL